MGVRRPWWDRALDGWRGYVVLVIVIASLVLFIKNDLSKPQGLAEQVCADAKAAKMGCVISPAQVVETEDGSVYLILNEKVFKLQ